MLTVSRLKELLHYDPLTGIFTWQINDKGCKAFSRAGCINGRGYRRIGIDGKSYQEHRLAWLYVYGVWPVLDIDHINRVKTDNRICNLREVTVIENHHNSAAIGVTYIPKRNRYQAYINSGKVIWLGYYKTFEEALLARMLGKIKYHPTSPQAQEFMRELTMCG